MSRRSLRLDEGLLDRSIPRGSASFSVGGASWRSNRSSRRSHLSASCSESLLVGSPRRALVPPLLSSSVASDASLLSSLLDDSVQESTLVDTFWGLDQEFDPKDATVLLNQRPVDAVLRCPKHLLHSHSPLHCGQCELQAAGAEASTIYGRDRSRKSTTDVLQMWLRPFRLCVSRAAASCVRVLAHTWQVCEELFSQDGHGAAPGLCGVMDLKESTSTQKELHPDGSLYLKYEDRLRLSCRNVSVKLLSPTGDAAGDRRRINRRWCHMTSSFLLTGSAVLLLLLLSLCWFGPALQSVNVTEWTHSPPAGGAGEVLTDSREELIEREASLRSVGDVSPGDVSPGDGSPGDGSVRLLRLEEGLVELGERVQAGGREAERRHEEVLQLYEELRLLVSDQSRREEAEPWMRNLMEQKLEQLSRGLEDRRQTEKSLQKDSLQSQKTRLDQLELKLQEEQWRREADSSSSSSSSLAADGMSHDALLSEVAQLAAALQDVRRDVEGLSGCEESCRRLDGIQQAISAQVREEVRLLFYGNQLSVVDGAPPPEEGPALQEPLVQRYVSTDDLQAALLALELRLLQNVSRQLEGHRGGEDSALTQEDVEDIVTGALRLFSQDRTGLADFALESGGGSILTARCSETFQTKAALLSLFGLPLWYFSQSPRAVIQPDVHPGNCWAFRGSKGFLVIRLSMKILPTAFSMEHIDRAMTPSGSLESAPRDFTVYGLKEEEEDKEKKLLGSFTFDSEGEPLQTYHVTEENHEAFQLIEVQVLSNWGHQEYTCMYRFRVHGTPRPT